MSSKLDRWKKISATSNESTINENKKSIIEDLATVNIENEQEEEVEELVVEKSNDPDNSGNSIKDIESVEDESRSKDDTPIKGVQKKPRTTKRREQESVQVDSFISKVNNNVRTKIENKVTKDMTHKKTSFLLSLTNIAKLENFDNAHGGRIKGEFINNLLEEAFAELELDSKWKKILNNNLDKQIEALARKR